MVFSKSLYAMQNHLGFAEKQLKHLAALFSEAHVVPYRPEPGLVLDGEPEPEFVIVHRQKMEEMVERLRSQIAVARRILQDYAAAHGETADYWEEGADGEQSR